jgi:hypothetical protein
MIAREVRKKGAYRNCENVARFKRNKPRMKVVRAGQFTDPRVKMWPTHRIIKELQEKSRKRTVIADICL